MNINLGVYGTTECKSNFAAGIYESRQIGNVHCHRPIYIANAFIRKDEATELNIRIVRWQISKSIYLF